MLGVLSASRCSVENISLIAVEMCVHIKIHTHAFLASTFAIVSYELFSLVVVKHHDHRQLKGMRINFCLRDKSPSWPGGGLAAGTVAGEGSLAITSLTGNWKQAMSMNSEVCL